MIYLGVNTGTSADAVDVVCCRYEGLKQTFIFGYEKPIDAELREKILDAVNDPLISYRDLQYIGARLAQYYHTAIQEACLQANIDVSAVQAVGLHGQTIHHCPSAVIPYTLQLDHAAEVSQALGMDVIAGFRANDIANGGQGAPIIPAYHRFLAQANQQNQAVFINLGGIANITWYNQENDTLLGWDIGPANALLDNWIKQNQGLDYDHKGQWAQSGKVIEDLYDQFAQDAYFSMPAPKSTGRDYFNIDWLHKNIRNEKPEDIQATLVELTVRQIACAIESVAAKSTAPVYLYGKGVRNSYLVQRLKSLCGKMHICATEEIHIPAQWLEGGLYAWLAYCYQEKVPIDLSQVTGAKKTSILGAKYYGKVSLS